MPRWPLSTRNKIDGDLLDSSVLKTWFFLNTLLPLVLGLILMLTYVSAETFFSFAWAPELDIAASFRIDGLSILFAVLICGIGFLVQIYSISYMAGKTGRFSFHLYLTLFMLAMLGLVLSENLILLFIFWELTTVTSYLLIGFNNELEKSRKNALQALLVTGIGGLALLAGLILLGEAAGSYSLETIFNQIENIQESPLFLPSLILILLGAFTKSAQFPFHFWLPNAMAAPTPVSAYLHSATMVKAGVYLLALVAPIYASSQIWLYALSITGGLTFLWSALMALRQTDLKLMLAYSTVAALGKITFLLAFDTDYTVTAALLLIVAHAFYKAALFMVVGNIDKSTGTREISDLLGLRSPLVFTFFAGLVSALSAIGIPPLLGFISKEYVYKAGLEIDWWAAILLVLVNGIIAGLILTITVKPFLSNKGIEKTKSKPIENSIGLWVPCIVLGILGFLIPVTMLSWLEETFITPAALAVNPNGQAIELLLWQGINLPLILSVVTVILGVIIYKIQPWIKTSLDQTIGKITPASRVYELMLGFLLKIAQWQTNILQPKRLSVYTLLFFVSLAALLISQLDFGASQFNIGTLGFYEFSLAVLLSIAALLCIFATSRLLAIASLGMIGFLTTLVFMIYSAPDVAKTQLLVETLIVVFLTLIIRHLPTLDTVPYHSMPRRFLNFGVASIVGLSVAVLLVTVISTPLDTQLPEFFAENSVPGGHGRNIVNVILVDFRAFDTLGEIIVVVIAAIASIGLLKTKGMKKT